MKSNKTKFTLIQSLISVILSVTVLFSGGVFIKVYAAYVSDTEKAENIPQVKVNPDIGTSCRKTVKKADSDPKNVQQTKAETVTKVNSEVKAPTVSFTEKQPDVNSYSNEDLYWLAKIIYAESRGESYEGKIAVGNVVLNRVKSTSYPNTVYGVIFDTQNGVQFSPVADGSIYLDADEESLKAAKACLEGYSISDSILFFVNNNISADNWAKANRPLEMSIGNHDFYA